ncbi:MAG TPA: class I SAM-dependent methyltransferase [Thermoleophilia bacterium]|nr:class I SAM-dependent methyltransferase [Thermoleophilia bacterium]
METFAISFYGSSVAAVARTVQKRVTKIGSAVHDDWQKAERLLSELDDLLAFEFPNRRRRGPKATRVDRAVLLLLIGLSNAPPLLLLAAGTWLWLVQVCRTRVHLTLATSTLDMATTTSTLLMITTLFIAVTGVWWYKSWQGQIKRQEREAHDLINRKPKARAAGPPKGGPPPNNDSSEPPAGHRDTRGRAAGAPQGDGPIPAPAALERDAKVLESKMEAVTQRSFPRVQPAARWVGRRDTGPMATLLARRLADGSVVARWRFRLKLLTAPHVAVSDYAVVGLVPAGVSARSACSVVNLVATLAIGGGVPVASSRLPPGLRFLPRDWRVVNLAASDAPRRPGAALALGRLVVALADEHRAILRADARTDDSRLLPAYVSLGFLAAPTRPGALTVHVVRPRHSADSARRATRQHYEAYPFVEGGDRRVRHWVRCLTPLLPDDLVVRRRVLDLGCGSGDVSFGLLSRGASPVALDLTSAAVRRLRERQPSVPVCRGDALALPFADASFDHVVSIGVLHHTPDWRRALSEAARVVRAGGRVVVMVYAAHTPYHLVWACAAALRARLPVQALERLPEWALAATRVIVAAQVGQRLPDAQLRRLLADQLWTPVAAFVSRRDLDNHAASVGLTPVGHVPLLWHAHLVAYERLLF